MSTADVIVVGLGAHGSAVAWQLARRGARVLGLDRFAPPHDRGSSHGETRITRLAPGEGDAYAPLVRRSHAIWQELEAAAGAPQSLYVPTGGLVLAPGADDTRHHGKAGFVARTVAIAERHGIAHEVLDAAAIARRFPAFVLTGDEVGYYEPTAGFVRPEACIRAQLEAARGSGAQLHTDEPVLSIEPTASGVAVRTARATYEAPRAVVTAGAWIPELAGGVFARRLGVYRQTLHWFEVDDPAPFRTPGFPVFIWMRGRHDGDYVYGFPMADGIDGVKMATEQYVDTVEPAVLRREVDAAESARMFEQNVRSRFRGVRPRAVHAAACLYTVSPDGDFVIGPHPRSDRVLVVSACSGHGFKHSAGLGEAIAETVLAGRSAVDLAPFAAARLA